MCRRASSTWWASIFLIPTIPYVRARSPRSKCTSVGALAPGSAGAGSIPPSTSAGATSALDQFLGVAGLVELDPEVTRHLEVGHEAVALIRNLIRKLHSARLQLRDGFLNIVAVKRDIVSAGARARAFVGRVAAHFGFGEIEDEPTVTDVRIRKAELVPKEGAHGLGFGGIEHGVDAFYHTPLL